jgi:hypothetical protein
MVNDKNTTINFKIEIIKEIFFHINLKTKLKG